MGKGACIASAIDELQGVATEILCYNLRNEVPTRNSIETEIKELLLSFILSRADGGIKVIIIMC